VNFLRRNNSLALKEIQDGFSYQVKEKMRHYKSAKELWLQLENCYQNKEKNKEMENSNQFIEQNKEVDNSNQSKEQNTEK
jgi:phage/plasmid-associated DNA primase